MLELTEAARKRLHKSLSSTGNPGQEDRCFRIVPKDEKFLTLKLARPAPGDTVFTHEGDNVLALPKSLQMYCDGKSLNIDSSGKLKLS